MWTNAWVVKSLSSMSQPLNRQLQTFFRPPIFSSSILNLINNKRDTSLCPARSAPPWPRTLPSWIPEPLTQRVRAIFWLLVWRIHHFEFSRDEHNYILCSLRPYLQVITPNADGPMHLELRWAVAGFSSAQQAGSVCVSAKPELSLDITETYFEL